MFYFFFSDQFFGCSRKVITQQAENSCVVDIYYRKWLKREQKLITFRAESSYFLSRLHFTFPHNCVMFYVCFNVCFKNKIEDFLAFVIEENIFSCYYLILMHMAVFSVFAICQHENFSVFKSNIASLKFVKIQQISSIQSIV